MAHWLTNCLRRLLLRDDTTPWKSSAWEGSICHLRGKALLSRDQYFYIYFPLGSDCVLFFNSPLLLYNFSVKGQTLAPFPPTSMKKRTRETLGPEEYSRETLCNEEMCCLHLSALESSRSSRTLVWAHSKTRDHLWPGPRWQPHLKRLKVELSILQIDI